MERTYGRFERVIGLPTDVKVESARAEFKDGVLEVRIPKVEGAKERKIDIA
ncbi:MAG: Hsp20/alpha crystallin family protein [Aquificaceae bacterium]|nr:Hsp20/alpha crystallin family protein [Aquificaceae bacterium]